MSVTIYTPPGIGDAYWTLMKVLPNTDQQINLKVASAEHYRASFLSYIDGVNLVSEDNFSYSRIKKLAAQKYPYKKIEPTMYMELNTWLEAGKRIEDYLPQLDTWFRLQWKLDRLSYQKAKHYRGKKTIAIHTSSLKYNQMSELVGTKWKPEYWAQIVHFLYEALPADTEIVWLGAKYDREMLEVLSQFKGIKAAVEQPADVVMQILRSCQGFISYQCGLSVISICEAIPTYMIYFDWLDKIADTFCPWSSIGVQTLYQPDYFTRLAEGRLRAPAEWARRLV